MDNEALAAHMMTLFQSESETGLAFVRSVLTAPESIEIGSEQVHEVYRSLHTLSGSANMNGLALLAQIAGILEKRWQSIYATKSAVDIHTRAFTLHATECLSNLLYAGTQVNATLGAQAQSLIDQSSALPNTQGREEYATPDLDDVIDPPPSSKLRLWAVTFKPGQDLMRRGVDVLGLFEELAGLGQMAIVASAENLPTLNQMAPDVTYLHWNILLCSEVDQETIEDVFMFVANDSTVSLVCLADTLPDDWVWDDGRIFYALSSSPNASPQQLKRDLGLLPTPKDTSEPIKDTKTPPLHVDSEHSPPATTVVPVPLERLDRQVDLVGELVIAQSTLLQIAAELHHPALTMAVEQVARLTTEMRNNAMQLRMVPVAGLLTRLERLVATTAQRLGQAFTFTSSGTHIEMDMMVLQSLEAPLETTLVQLCEQSFESTSQRQAAGKSASGNLSLSIDRSGEEVIMSLSTDGSGSRCNNLPSLRSAVELLRGTLDIRNTPDQGSVFTLRMPLTQGIIEGLLVAVCGEKFVMPLVLVEEVVNLTTAKSLSSHQQDILNLRGQVVPFMRLGEVFGLSASARTANNGHVIIVQNKQGERTGILVDQVIGQHQTVLKNMSSLCTTQGALSGATILSDGTVALVLDVLALLDDLEQEEIEPNHGL